jgi:DNA-binding CsgD family transcriptional regulator
MHGEPGVGKTALLEYLESAASDCRIVRATGVQSEMELAFAGVHQLCSPMLDLLDRLPEPQRDALRTAFGMRAGPVPDRFLIGLAVLGLFAEYAAERPLICIVDDEQWLDQSSVQVLAFVARRLLAESVGVVFAGRLASAELAGLPQLAVGNLCDADARSLLDAALVVPLDTILRDRIVAETRGNPLALVEVPQALASPELAGGFGLPGSVPHAGRIEDSFKIRVDALPDSARRLLVVAAAEPAGDPSLVWSAAASLGIDADAATPATESGLADFGVFVRFRHPLARSVVYRSASLTERRHAHRALAGAMDARRDPDRYAWHRAHAAAGPDEAVADELEASAGRAGARGGLAAAAAFLERSATLTVSPGRRAVRALAAASAKLDAGALPAATKLLELASAGPLDEVHRVRVDLVRARLAFATSRGRDAAPLLLTAAKRFEPIDPSLARATYFESLTAAVIAGRFTAGVNAVDVALAAAPSTLVLSNPTPLDLLLHGLAIHLTESYRTALPLLQSALATLGGDLSKADELRWLWLAFITTLHIWDEERWRAVCTRYVEVTRNEGALSELPLALNAQTLALLLAGRLDAAEALTVEAQAAAEATGSPVAQLGALALAAMRGNAAKTARLTDGAIENVTRRGSGIGYTVIEWANAVLNNGLGRFDQAMTAAESATTYPSDLGASSWALAELVEAAARVGRSDEAVVALQRLTEMTDASGSDWGLGIGARSRALVTESGTAEPLYLEAIERLGRTQTRTDLARAHLLYGEWLGHVRRRAEARAQLRSALTMFDAMGMHAFAGRARRALRAAGETARDRQPAAGLTGELTAQEAQIARLARDGLSNPEIGARLFISSRTVQYHLRKVFAKLGISSRGQLDRALPTSSH